MGIISTSLLTIGPAISLLTAPCNAHTQPYDVQRFKKLHETEELKALFCPIPGKSNRVAVHEQDKTKASCESLLRWGHVGLTMGLTSAR